MFLILRDQFVTCNILYISSKVSKDKYKDYFRSILQHNKFDFMTNYIITKFVT